MEGSKLFVGNLKYSVSADELKELFSEHGEVKDVKVIEGKGFGFVEMSTSEEAQKAKEALDKSDFQGRSMNIDVARPMKKREDRGGFRRDFRGGNRY